MALHERPVDRRSPEPPRLPEPSPACPSTGNYLDLGRGHYRDDGRTRISRRRVDSPVQELSPAPLQGISAVVPNWMWPSAAGRLRSGAAGTSPSAIGLAEHRVEFRVRPDL